MRTVHGLYLAAGLLVAAGGVITAPHPADASSPGGAAIMPRPAVAMPAAPATARPPSVPVSDPQWPCFTELTERLDRDGRVDRRPDLVGHSVREVRALAHGPGPAFRRFRVLGADGRCFDATADYADTRIDVFVRNGRVLWAATF